MAYENRKYVIIPAAAITDVDFGQIMETSPATCRYSIDGTKTFVKYDGDIPASVAAIGGRSSEYGHEEMLGILSTAEWTTPYMPG